MTHISCWYLFPHGWFPCTPCLGHFSKINLYNIKYIFFWHLPHEQSAIFFFFFEGEGVCFIDQCGFLLPDCKHHKGGGLFFFPPFTTVSPESSAVPDTQQVPLSTCYLICYVMKWKVHKTLLLYLSTAVQLSWEKALLNYLSCKLNLFLSPRSTFLLADWLADKLWSFRGRYLTDISLYMNKLSLLLKGTIDNVYCQW